MNQEWTALIEKVQLQTETYLTENESKEFHSRL